MRGAVLSVLAPGLPGGEIARRIGGSISRESLSVSSCANSAGATTAASAVAANDATSLDQWGRRDLMRATGWVC